MPAVTVKRLGSRSSTGGRRALVVAALALTLLWAALALAWLAPPPGQTDAARQLQSLLRAYGKGEPFVVPRVLATREPCLDDISYGGIDACRPA